MHVMQYNTQVHFTSASQHDISLNILLLIIKGVPGLRSAVDTPRTGGGGGRARAGGGGGGGGGGRGGGGGGRGGGRGKIPFC